MEITENQSFPKKWQVPFFTIWSGQALSMLGSSIAQFALIWWLTTSTRSATVLAAATLAGMLPGILLGPFIGTLTDRWNRRVVMIVADSTMAVGALILAYLSFSAQLQIWHVYAIMVLRSVGGSFHWSSMSSSTSLMVPKEYLSKIAGLNQTLNGIINIIGPPLGALCLQLLALHQVMMIDIITAIIATLPLYFIFVPQPVRSEEQKTNTFGKDFKEGLVYIFNWKSMIGLIIMIFFIKITLVPAFSLLPLLVADYFGKGAFELSTLEMLFGAGIILGGVAMSIWGGFKRKMNTMMLGVVFLGSGMLGLGFAPNSLFWIALIFSGIMGIGVTFTDATFMAILQTSIEPEIQGRTFGTVGSLLNMSSPLGLIIAGPVSDRFGIQVWFLITGILCFIGMLVWVLKPAWMDIENKPSAPASPEAILYQPEIAD